MAVVGAVRWKPDVYRSTMNTTIQGFDPAGTVTNPETGTTEETGIPSGGIVMIAQAVAYDDGRVVKPGNGGGNPNANANAYKAGKLDTEVEMVVLYEEPIVKNLAAFADMTQEDADAEWQTALESFRDRIAPAMPTLIKAMYTARMAPPIDL